jgi:O-antigen ligase
MWDIIAARPADSLAKASALTLAAWAASLLVGGLALVFGGAWLAGGLVLSSSAVAAVLVLAVAVALAAATGMPRRALAAGTAALAFAGIVAFAVLVAGGSAASVTSDRSTLVADTAAVAAGHPVIGVGLAAQPLVTRAEQAPDTSELQNVSHTTPLTVAAELGIVGVALFAALVAGAALVLVRVARRDRALALGLGSVLLALLVHSLFYAGLFENPITWGALGVAGAAAGERPAAPRPLRSLRSWGGPR